MAADAGDLVVHVAPRREWLFAKAAVTGESGLVLRRRDRGGRIGGVRFRRLLLGGGLRRERREYCECNVRFHACPRR
jgi:hypothetical protein